MGAEDRVGPVLTRAKCRSRPNRSAAGGQMSAGGSDPNRRRYESRVRPYQSWNFAASLPRPGSGRDAGGGPGRPGRGRPSRTRCRRGAGARPDLPRRRRHRMPRLAGQEQEPAIFVRDATRERERPVVLPRQAGREGEIASGSSRGKATIRSQKLRCSSCISDFGCLPRDLVSLAKEEHPGALNYAVASTGGPTHLVAVQFEMAAGVKIQQVPYKGGAASMTDLMGGHVQVGFATPGSAVPYVRTEN